LHEDGEITELRKKRAGKGENSGAPALRNCAGMRNTGASPRERQGASGTAHAQSPLGRVEIVGARAEIVEPTEGKPFEGIKAKKKPFPFLGKGFFVV